MLKNILTNDINGDLASTIILSIFLIILFITVNIIFHRKFKNYKIQQRLRARVFYLFFTVYIIFLTHIWIDGFTHIFTVLGLVSAAIVVTNKETIMNLVGWSIILWRGLFVEGDYIEVLGKTGYIEKLGPFYISLVENNPKIFGTTLGKHIKIPNGCIINTPIINYSQLDFGYHLSSIDFKLKGNPLYKSIIDQIMDNVNKAIIDHVESHLQNHPEKRKQIQLIQLIKNSLTIMTKPAHDNPEHITCILEYKCFFADSKILDKAIAASITHTVFANESL